MAERGISMSVERAACRGFEALGRRPVAEDCGNQRLWVIREETQREAEIRIAGETMEEEMKRRRLKRCKK
ncbi:hypothetical protein EYF80_058252 [Liparis tanakae]|uniref:Uncharacterized protein n=1 Tax=Liparis tanakae TaxID=230148 RepID=A0A4Z2ET92_9TELE|nr:hypothetical protein EYF80_058252 [Liparis tanakae]